MGRAPCCEKVGLKRGRWTAEEDEILKNYIEANGEGSWRSLPKNAGLLRCGKSCRLRWINYLRSDLKRGNITAAEEEIIINLHATLGNRWSVISGYLPGRTDNEIKNYWNSHLSRRIHSFIRRPDPHFTLPPDPARQKEKKNTKKKVDIDKTPEKGGDQGMPCAGATDNNKILLPVSDDPGIELDSLMEDLSGIWPEIESGGVWPEIESREVGGTSPTWKWDDVNTCWGQEVNTLPWSCEDEDDHDRNRVSSCFQNQVGPHHNHNEFISWLFS